MTDNIKQRLIVLNGQRILQNLTQAGLNFALIDTKEPKTPKRILTCTIVTYRLLCD